MFLNLIMEHDIILSSKLFKRSYRWPYTRRWQQRLFALTSTQLIYFKHNLEDTPRKKINRSDIISLICSENAKNIYEFEIIFQNRSMRLRALTIEYRNKWLFYLKPRYRYSQSHVPILKSRSLSLQDYVRTIPSPLLIIKLLLMKRWSELHRGMTRFKEGVSFRRSVSILREYNKKMSIIMRIELAARILHKLHGQIGTYVGWIELKSNSYRHANFTQKQNMSLMSLFEVANIRLEVELYSTGFKKLKRFAK